MYIEVLNDKKLKVELEFDDMQKLNIDKNSFICRDLAAKRALKTILKDAYLQTGFDIFNTQLSVEIFPTVNNGCLILFTRTSAKRFKATAMRPKNVFVFSKIDDLIDCLKIILHKESLSGSVVYKLKSKYYLYLDNKLQFDKSVLLVLSEYAFAKTYVSKTYLDEFGEIVFKNLR